MFRKLIFIIKDMEKRGVMLLAASVIILLPLLALADLTSFAIISDSHVGAEDSVYGTFIRMLEEQKIDVIIHTGDAIHKPGKSSQWKRFLELTGQGKTLYLAPGNHDIYGKASLATYLKFFGKPYYSFVDGDTLVLLLNTELPGEESRVTGEQFTWLANELKRPFRYKFVFLHEPLFPFWTGHGLDRHEAVRDRLHRLFVEQGVALVVSGHEHLYLRKEKEGITYVIAAASGGQPQFYRKDTDFFRYIVASRTKVGYSFVVRDLEGGAKDEFTITR
jgi:3',5'-cyclic AMP phosphodiesterase CpdA